ncbi:MAG TPA: DUF4329 domain-containing protein [Planktothrix sp.]|jgi:hypothetical protein
MKSGKPGHQSIECGGYIYERKDGTFTYTKPIASQRAGEFREFGKSMQLMKADPQAETLVGWYHTHPDSWDTRNEGFSPEDRNIINGIKSPTSTVFEDTVKHRTVKLTGYIRNFKGDIIERAPGDEFSTRLYQASAEPK